MKLLTPIIIKILNRISLFKHYSNRIKKDEFIVINPNEIVELIRPPFPYKGLAESEYINFLSETEFLVNYYESNHKLPPAENEEMQQLINKFSSAFLDARFYINVNRMLDGTYKVASNGRHRMYVAKNYNFKLLVHLGGEEIAK